MTEKNSKQEHLGKLSRDFAVFLPAISNFYNTFVSKQRVTEGKHIAEDRIPKGFENGVESAKKWMSKRKSIFCRSVIANTKRTLTNYNK